MQKKIIVSTAGGCKCRQGSICQESSDSCSWCYVDPGNTCSDTRGSGTGYTLYTGRNVVINADIDNQVHLVLPGLHRHTQKEYPDPDTKTEREG